MKKQKRNTTYLILFLIFFTIALLALSGLFLLRHLSPDGEKRQETEESIADQYLIDIAEGRIRKPEETLPDDEGETEEETEGETKETEEEWEDTVEWIDPHGMVYTPEYAQGYLDCVLEIEKIQLRRGVYTGTMNDINRDLDMWMTVASHPYYKLGETHYCIYGHNHPVQSLSFNRVKYVQPGDYFTLTNEDGVRLYLVTDFFADWRNNIADNIVYNFDLPENECYILTCGRDEYRCKDIVVKGELYDIFDVKDWNENKQAILNAMYNGEEYKEMLAEQKAKEERIANAEQLDLVVNADGHLLSVNLVDSKGNAIKGAKLAIFDEDGLIEKQWTQGNSEAAFTLDEGLHTVGILSMPDDYTEYYTVAEKEINITKGKTIIRKVTEIKDEQRAETGRNLILYISLGLSIVCAILFFILYLTSKPKDR